MFQVLYVGVVGDVVVVYVSFVLGVVDVICVVYDVVVVYLSGALGVVAVVGDVANRSGVIALVVVGIFGEEDN